MSETKLKACPGINAEPGPSCRNTTTLGSAGCRPILESARVVSKLSTAGVDPLGAGSGSLSEHNDRIPQHRSFRIGEIVLVRVALCAPTLASSRSGRGSI